jgi:hypothetical protein
MQIKSDFCECSSRKLYPLLNTIVHLILIHHRKCYLYDDDPGSRNHLNPTYYPTRESLKAWLGATLTFKLQLFFELHDAILNAIHQRFRDTVRHFWLPLAKETGTFGIFHSGVSSYGLSVRGRCCRSWFYTPHLASLSTTTQQR